MAKKEKQIQQATIRKTLRRKLKKIASRTPLKTEINAGVLGV
jgi:hypothetical protein